MASITNDRQAEALQRLSAASRPREIEEQTNLHLVHPGSRWLALRFIAAGISPNAISILGCAVAFGAAASFYFLDWPWGAVLGFMALVLHHMLDGADGLVARATNTQSAVGEIVDGICDHLGFAAIYVSLAAGAYFEIGPAGVLVAVLAALSNVVQANGYEGQRRTYGYWVHGKTWIGAKTPEAREGTSKGLLGRLMRPLADLYVKVQHATTGEDAEIERLMRQLGAQPGPRADAARAAYREWKMDQVKRWSLLGQNTKTMAIGISMLLGSPLYFFAFVIVVLNAAFVLFLMEDRRAKAMLLPRFQALSE